MIQINLLPEELRVKSKIKDPGPAHEIASKPAVFSPEQLFIYAVPVLLGLFICAHIYLAVVFISKNGQLAALNRKWVELAPQKELLDKFSTEFSAASQDASRTRLLTNKRVLWAQKLNKLSLNLPSGVWFNQITISAKDIVIHGSVISFTKEEVNLINQLLENLKKDSEFFKDFTSFELSDVQKRNVGGYDIADFILMGALKAR